MSVGQIMSYKATAQSTDHSEQEVTLMLRGIACKLMDDGVKQILDQVGLRGKFSLVYVPCVVANKSNLGYAFVRFRTWAYAEECFKACDGKPFGLAAQGKLCRVTLANIQVAVGGQVWTTTTITTSALASTGDSDDVRWQRQ